MLLTNGNELTEETREALREEIDAVLATASEIQRTRVFDESVQRIVLTLPKHHVHMARFLAILEIETMPASLRLWQHVGSIEDGEAPALQRKVGRMMRAYLEEELMTRIGAAMMCLKAEAEGKQHPK